MLHQLGFSVDIDEDTIRLDIVGEIDVATAPEILEVLAAAACTDATQIVLDMGSVTFLDSTGVAALIEAHHTLQATQRRLTVMNVQAHVLAVMTIAGVVALLGADDEGIGSAVRHVWDGTVEGVS